MDKTVLVIDDDAKLQSQLREYLAGYGFAVHSSLDGANALANLRAVGPDIVILDVMLPGKDGFEVLADLRRESQTPLIMLTARGEDSDRIVGLEMGADDYLSKPFNPRELLARMKAVLRRSDQPCAAPAAENILELDGLRLDILDRLLCAGGTELYLPPTECRLLEVLMRSPDRPLSRDTLMDQVWGRDFEAYDRSIDVHVSKLRSVLKTLPGHEDRIRTVWGTGYLFRSGS